MARLIYKLEIECDNASFWLEGEDSEITVADEVPTGPHLEVARKLRHEADRLEKKEPGFYGSRIFDTNGNTVGHAGFQMKGSR